MQFLAMGDSYTIGEGVDPRECWPTQLTAALRAADVDLQPPRIVARTGWTTDELHAGILQENLPTTFDLVTLLIGVNNQYRGLDSRRFADEFESLLRLAIELAAGRREAVIALSIPEYGKTPFALERQLDSDRISAELGVFNAIVAAAARKTGVHWIDVSLKFRQAQHEHNMLAADGLHPSGQMYALWVEEILPIAQQVLNSSRQPSFKT
jgi:lysophospholipase L1-like esterase